MIKVLKFGGSSVATPEKINAIAEYLYKRICKGEKLVVVASAMGKETDILIKLANEVSKKPVGRELDQLLVTGEIRTVALMAMALNNLGAKAMSLKADQLGIHAKGDYQNAKIHDIDIDFIKENLNEYDALIVAGFQGVNYKNELVTLGRGGSDTSAVAIAGSLGVACEIYTDVDGIYSTDPRICPIAKKLDYISYEEMNELSSLGATVMHNRSITLASKFNIDIYVGKTLSKERGTVIMNKDKNTMEQNVVTAVATEKEVFSISIRFESGSDIDNIIMQHIAESKINIDMISQVYFEQETNFAFTCSQDDADKVSEIISKIKENKAIKHIQTKSYAKLSIVGLGMRDASGVVGRVFNALRDSKVNFYQVTTSEITISMLIKKEDLNVAVNSIVNEFGVVEQN